MNKTKATDALDQAAQELEGLVKSVEPEKQEESLAEALVKSAAAVEKEPEPAKEPEPEPVKEAAASVAESMKKSLDDSEAYQQVVDVAEPIGVLGDAMVKGFGDLEKSQGDLTARVTRMEQNLGLIMRAQAAILRQQEERTPIRKPMMGHFGGFQKSQSDEKKAPFTAAQLDRAAMLLIEEGKLPNGSGARLSVAGAESLYKSFDVPTQELFAKVIEREKL